MSTVNFNLGIAVKIGIGPAVLLSELDKMQGNSLMDDKGRCWTHQHMPIISAVLPLYSIATIRNYLYILEDHKFITTKRITPHLYYSINRKKLEKFD